MHILDGVDLNTEAARILASYHKPIDVESASGDFFANDEELAAAFAQHSKELVTRLDKLCLLARR